MKKKLKYALLTTGVIALATTTTVSISTLVSCSSDTQQTSKPDNEQPNTPESPNNKPQIKMTLTAQKVKENFSPNGIWANKNILTSQDLEDFDSITIDAFKHFNNQLNSIEIDNNKSLLDSNNKPITIDFETTLRWDSINEIKINPVVDKKDATLITCSGLIYCKDYNSNQYAPISLENKIQPISIVFPTTSDNLFPENSTVIIPNNFYEKFYTGNNIKSISFSTKNQDDTITKTLVNKIGNFAFLNCNILDVDLLFNAYINTTNANDTSIYIGESAFQNTNIQTLSFTQYFSKIEISKNAFSNNINLQSITLLDAKSITINERAFAEDSPSLSIMIAPDYNINQEPFIFNLGANIFSRSNAYSKFEVTFMLGDSELDKYQINVNNTSLANITVNNINSFKFTLNYSGVQSYTPLIDHLKQQFSNSGLPQEYSNRIQGTKI